jgi:glycine betaine/proline transport system substrate-binding protein
MRIIKNNDILPDNNIIYEKIMNNNILLLIIITAIVFLLLVNTVHAEEDNYKISWSHDTNHLIESVAVSSNGSYIAVGSDDKVRLFDKEGNNLWNYKTKGTVKGVSISSDGFYILAGSADNYIYLFDKKGNLIWNRKLISTVYGVSISSNGSFMVAGTDGPTRVYLLNKEGDFLWERIVYSSVEGVAISPDGSYIAIGAVSDFVYYYDNNGQLLWSYKTGADVQGVSIFPDGSLAVGSDDDYIYFLNKEGNFLWDYKKSKAIVTISTSNNSYILTGSRDGYIYLLNRNGQLLWDFNLNEPVKSVSISSDGSYIAAGSDKIYFFEKVNSSLTTSNSISDDSNPTNKNWMLISIFVPLMSIILIIFVKSRNNIQIKRGYEVLQNNDIRLGIRVKNNTNHIILDVETAPNFNKDLFELKDEQVVNIGNIKPGSEMTAKYVLKPLSCVHNETIDAIIKYSDHKGKQHSMKMQPLEVQCVYPFLKEKIMQESEFVKLSLNSKHIEEGISFIGIGVNEIVDIIKSCSKNRLFIISDHEIENARILYLAGESIGDKTYYLLTAVILPYKNSTQVALRVFSDKPYGLHGFLNEIAESVRHLVSSIQSAKEIGIIENKQVINIIDSIVQRTKFEGMINGGPVELNIEDSIIQRSNINTIDEDNAKK